MKHTILVVILFCVLLSSQAQERSIDFQYGSLDRVADMAKIADKDVLLYFTAVWCTPCREMEETAFKDSAVVAFIDKHFVALKVDIDSVEGKRLARSFNNRSVPQYVVINPQDRSLKYAFVGSMRTENFLQQLNESLDPANNELARSMEKYQEGNRDHEFLLDYLGFMDRHFDAGKLVYDELFALATAEQKRSEPVFGLMERYLRDEAGVDFQFVADNKDALTDLYGENRVNALLNRPALMQLESVFFEGDSAAFYRELAHTQHVVLGNADLQLFEMEANFLLRNKQSNQFIALVESARFPTAFADDNKRRIAGANLTMLNMAAADSNLLQRANTWMEQVDETTVQTLIVSGNIDEQLQKLDTALLKYEQALALYRKDHPDAVVDPSGILSLIDAVKKKIAAP